MHAQPGLTVCAKLMIDHDQKLGSLVLFHSLNLLPLFDDAILTVQRKIMEKKQKQTNDSRQYSLKMHCHARIAHLLPGYKKCIDSMGT